MDKEKIIALVESRASCWKRQEEWARAKGFTNTEVIYKAFRVEAEAILTIIKGED